MSAFLCGLPLLSAAFSFCAEPATIASGYVEGDYVLVAPLSTAQIDHLSVQRGDRVKAGQELARMQQRDAEIAVAQTEAALAQAQASLSNLLEGARPEEIKAIEATLASAQAKADDADRTAARQRSLQDRGTVTTADLEDAETAARVAHAGVAEVEANLAVARLPARVELIAAARAGVNVARAARDQAKWMLAQRQLVAPSDGTIFDIIRTEGEIGSPAAPVLSILPDGGVKLRVYVPETLIAQVHTGDRLAVHCDGCPGDLAARVSYVSDAPEFTPPVIYSLDSRQKLVFLVEARPDPASAALKPGQIVDVDLGGGQK